MVFRIEECEVRFDYLVSGDKAMIMMWWIEECEVRFDYLVSGDKAMIMIRFNVLVMEWLFWLCENMFK